MMPIFRRVMVVAAGWMPISGLLAGMPDAGFPPSLPLVVIDADFNECVAGLPPAKAMKEQTEAADAKPFWSRFPIRTCDEVARLTRTRRATVEAKALGLNDKPLVLVYEENKEPRFGPQVFFNIPAEVVRIAKRYRLTFDVAKGNQARSGGIMLDGVGAIRFQEDGGVLLGKTSIGRYQPSTPIHIEVILDASAQKAVFILNNQRESATEWPWTGKLNGVRFDGVLPGGFGEAPSSIAFDNLKLILEETL